jgi:hypothetical protein
MMVWECSNPIWHDACTFCRQNSRTHLGLHRPAVHPLRRPFSSCGGFHIAVYTLKATYHKVSCISGSSWFTSCKQLVFEDLKKHCPLCINCQTSPHLDFAKSYGFIMLTSHIPSPSVVNRGLLRAK